MYVIFDKGERKDLTMVCIHDDHKKQEHMMHTHDIDEQVKEWQKTNMGNPPIFYSRITVKEFTERQNTECQLIKCTALFEKVTETPKWVVQLKY